MSGLRSVRDRVEIGLAGASPENPEARRMAGSPFDLWMWERANALLAQAERLQRQFFQPVSRKWQPPIDVFETKDSFLVLVALPGVDPARVEVLLEGGRLVVRGSRSLPVPCQKAILHRMEIPCGEFERWVELPAGQYEPGGQEFVNGCLIFSMKKVG